MPPSPDFDEFYLASRRRLVLQAYALTGDLSAARHAVRDAFVSARHHWSKVRRLPDPEEWVRARAWARAQRRHAGRIWHRERGLGQEQRAVLDALHHLPDQQRKVLLLHRLAGLAVDDVGRELGLSPERVEQQLATALAAYERRSGVILDDVQASLQSLAPVAEAAALPPAPVVRRSGRRRRGAVAAGGTAVLVAATLLGGLLVVRPDAQRPDAPRAEAVPRRVPRPVTADLLLAPTQVARLAPGQQWRLVDTTDNTAGTGINSVCQSSRFADPRGRGTFVRSYASRGTPTRTLVQTVEISRSAEAAAAAYRTTLGWFAGCSEARLQLLNAYVVQGLGERAQVLALRIPGEVRRTYLVGLVRSGSLTLSTVVETRDGPQVPVAQAVSVLADSVRDVCRSDPAGPCPAVVSTAPVLPPLSGEARGTLAAADLPVVGRIARPWVGTRPVRARPNVAATTCDKADFVGAGARPARTRVFLIPQARLPRRFGITETYGTFPTPARARAFVGRIQAAMAACQKKDLGARVSQRVVQARAFRGSQYALWRLDSEIDRRRTVGFWMGVSRVGRYVAQVNFTPAGADDVDADTFQALVTRSRDRLFELPVRPR